MPKEGKVVQVLGGVVDVEFPAENMPNIYDALEIDRQRAQCTHGGDAQCD